MIFVYGIILLGLLIYSIRLNIRGINRRRKSSNYKLPGSEEEPQS